MLVPAWPRAIQVKPDALLEPVAVESDVADGVTAELRERAVRLGVTDLAERLLDLQSRAG